MAHHDPFDPIDIGNEELEEGDSVAITKMENGYSFMPTSIKKKLDNYGMELVTDMQREVVTIQRAQRTIDELVGEARAHGLSWAAVGWSTGLTAEGARVKWGETSN